MPATDPEPPTEATAPPEEEQITPAAPQTGGWQPPEPEPSPRARARAARAEPRPTPRRRPRSSRSRDKDDDEDDGDDWRTWSGKAINP